MLTIPAKIIKFMKSENWYHEREDKEKALSVMRRLGIDPSSEIGQFYKDVYGDLLSPKPVAQLLEINQFEEYTDYVRKRYAFPIEFIPITSDESEGMYLYNTTDQSVYDFELAEYNNFIEGKVAPRWKTFFDFLLWFIDDENLEDI